MFLIWSNEKGAWRAPHGEYTWLIERAARYDKTQAQQLVGPTNILNRGPYQFRETIIRAPEET